MQRRIHSIQEPEIQIKKGKGWQQGPGRQQAEIISKQSRTGQWQRSGVYPRVRTQRVGGKKTYTVATWRNKWQSTSVFLPGKFHGQRSLAGYSPWSGNESDMTERTYRVKVKSLSCVRLFATPWTVACQDPPSMGFSRQEYWSGLPFPSPGDLPDPGIELRSPAL